jgi:hypothetical protein
LHLDAGDVGGAYLCFAAEAGYSVFDIWTEAAALVRVDQWLERFEQLPARFPAGPSPDVKARAKLALLVGLLLRRPQHPEYRRWHERAFRYAQGDAVLEAIPQSEWVGGGYMDNLLGVRLGGGAALGHSLLLRGELAESMTLLATVGPLARQGGGTPFLLAGWLTAEAMMYSAIGNHEAAIATVREFRALCDTFAMHRMEVIVDFQEAFALIVGENAAGASAALERVSASLGPALHRDQMVFDLTGGLLALRTQAFDRAREHASALVASGERTGMRAFVVFGHLLAARAVENEDDATSVQSSLLRAREAGAVANLAIAEYVASLVETRLALRARDRASAIEWLRRAFALGRDRGFVHHFWFSRAETAELCTLALENAIEPEYARRLVARAVAAGAAGEPPVATGVA